jgi:putative PIN family toxin of toxin-antitoxin system
MRVVVDTNIIVSSLRFGGVPRQVLEAFTRGEYSGFTSRTAMEETEEVLQRKFKVSPAEWILISEVLREMLVVVPTPDLPNVSELRDKRDLHVLSAAEQCSADFIVSGDKDLLTLGQYKGVHIITASDFLARIGLPA